MYDKLAELEDIMEKYGIENVEELDKTFEYVNKIINAYKTGSWKKEKQELEIDRDTWQKACELACEHISTVRIITNDDMLDNQDNLTNYFYQQAKTEGNDE